MTPAQSAAKVESVAGFESDLVAHLQPGGIVASTDRFFIMIRPVRRDADPDALINPWMRWPDPDAWMVWLAAGDLSEALEMLWPRFGGGKLWLAFQTDGPARWIRTSLLRSILHVQRRRQQQRGDKATEAIPGGPKGLLAED